MAWSNIGYDGTITEIEWSRLSSNLGNGYVAASNGDCVVTAVGGARSVSVAAGALYGDGVLSTNSAPETVAMTTPVNGQWYVIALRRTWATNVSALVAIAATTTTTTTPTAPPSTLPTLNTNVGVLTDQPIAWAWCNSANTTVVVFDMRLYPMRTQPTPVSSAVARDAKFQSPTQGIQVWRDDLGAVETYYGLYNSVTNPGGRDTAGWYVDTRQTGLKTIQPTSAVIVSGTGSANAMGMVTFTNATSVSVNGVFTSAYKSYRILINEITPSVGGVIMRGRMRSAGSDNSGTSYDFHGARQFAANAVGQYDGTAANAWSLGNYTSRCSMVIDLHSPTKAFTTTGSILSTQWVSGVGYGGGFSGIAHLVNSGFDGFTLLADSGTFSGTIQVLGVVD